MKCQCGNEINIRMGSKLIPQGCKILTAVTVVITAQCEKCGAMFQVPIHSNSAVIKED